MVSAMSMPCSQLGHSKLGITSVYLSSGTECALLIVSVAMREQEQRPRKGKVPGISVRPRTYPLEHMFVQGIGSC
jgi:hypothetical protein